MATYYITVQVGIAAGGSTAVSVLYPSPFKLAAGDNVVFSNDGESQNTAIVSGFDSAFWNATSNIFLVPGGDSVTRAVKTGLSNGVSDLLSFTSIGYTSTSLTFEIDNGVIIIPISSPPIKMSDVMTFYGQTGTKNLTNFYKGGGIVPNITENANIPTSGTIQLLDFLSCAKTS